MLNDVIGLQRIEAAFVAMAAAATFTHLGFAWWWLLALFLVFDLSAVGYLAGPRAGAACYNAVHAYVGPAALTLVAVAGDLRGAAFVAGLWTFHVAIDRALGYGLKRPDAFHETHLGPIGPARRAARDAAR